MLVKDGVNITEAYIGETNLLHVKTEDRCGRSGTTKTKPFAQTIDHFKDEVKGQFNEVLLQKAAKEIDSAKEYCEELELVANKGEMFFQQMFYPMFAAPLVAATIGNEKYHYKSDQTVTSSCTLSIRGEEEHFIFSGQPDAALILCQTGDPLGLLEIKEGVDPCGSDLTKCMLWTSIAAIRLATAANQKLNDTTIQIPFIIGTSFRVQMYVTSKSEKNPPCVEKKHDVRPILAGESYHEDLKHLFVDFVELIANAKKLVTSLKLDALNRISKSQFKNAPKRLRAPRPRVTIVTYSKPFLSLILLRTTRRCLRLEMFEKQVKRGFFTGEQIIWRKKSSRELFPKVSSGIVQ